MLAFLNKLVLSLLVLWYGMAGFVHSCHSASNLALHKPYWTTPSPGYPHTAPPGDRSSLTDGRHTTGHFWMERTTVGWWPVRNVEILIDLEKTANIGKITFNTVRGEYAGVRYPRHIYAFVGPDRDHLQYAGDLADDPGNLPGPYRVKRFALQLTGVKGRFILLEITAERNNSVFCDEIEVCEGKNEKGQSGSLTLDAARQMADRLNWNAPYKDFLDSFAETGGASAKTLGNFSDRIAAARKRLGRLASLEDLESIESDIRKLRAEILQAQHQGQQILVESVKPWAQLKPLTSHAGASAKGLSLAMPQGGSAQDAFLVTNISQGKRSVAVSSAPMPAGSPEIALHQAPFVKSASTELVADPLVPVASGFTLGPGESRMIFVSTKGGNPGSWKTEIRISSNGQKALIPADCRVFPVALPKTATLNSVNWGYLSFPLISDRREEAVKDLFGHHTNVVVVPPAYLKGANQAATADVTEFLRLEKYLKAHHGATKVLLGLGFGTAKRTTATGKHPFLSEPWKEGFRKWYANALLSANSAGFDEGRIYLYPYDEMGGQQLDDFVRFAVWVKKEFPSAKLYATLGEATLATKGWEKVLPYLDIAQAFTEEMFRKARPARGESWIYSTEGPSRSLPPYSYYRLMPWKAFLHDFTGVGFWAYADTEDFYDPESSWDEAGAGGRDFGVIYRGKGGSIISSRRWEAWRMGIEDYELLKMYARAKGGKAAKALAKAVLDHPADTTKADEVRLRILTVLSGS